MMIDLRQDELDSQAYFEWLSKFEAKKTKEKLYLVAVLLLVTAWLRS